MSDDPKAIKGQPTQFRLPALVSVLDSCVFIDWGRHRRVWDRHDESERFHSSFNAVAIPALVFVFFRGLASTKKKASSKPLALTSPPNSGKETTSEGMSGCEDYLNRRRPRRLGLRTYRGGEIHPLKAFAIIWSVLLKLPFLAATISPATTAIVRRICR